MEETSWQSHKKRSEFWHIVSGDGTVHIADKEYNVIPGAEYNAEVGVKHRWIAGPSGMILVEVATGDFDEEDITRYEDKYGRA
jgi:mannose-6-phosphate isomerase-like protein (cupin superfamily)